MKNFKNKFKELIEKHNFDPKIKKHILDSYDIKFNQKDNDLITLLKKEEEKLEDKLKNETELFEKKVAEIKNNMNNQRDAIINNELQKRLKTIAEFYVIDINVGTK